MIDSLIGKTTDSDSVVLGSSPGQSAKLQRGAMAAHLTVNQNVIGSSPVAGASLILGVIGSTRVFGALSPGSSPGGSAICVRNSVGRVEDF